MIRSVPIVLGASHSLPKPNQLVRNTVGIFMLTDKQLLTIKHVHDRYGYTKPLQIIEFCVNKLALPRYSKTVGRSGSRKHSRKHYQGIVDYLAQGNQIPL